jgi:hypothetical protein
MYIGARSTFPQAGQAFVDTLAFVGSNVPYPAGER